MHTGGRLVQWGGVLTASRNLKDRTELEVTGYALDACARPETGSAAVGRFILVVPAIRRPLTIAQAWLPTEAIQLMHQGRPNAVPAWEAHRGCREDLIDPHSSRIEQRGYALSQARPGVRATGNRTGCKCKPRSAALS